MVFSDEDKILTKNLYWLKGYKAMESTRISKQMMDKKWH